MKNSVRKQLTMKKRCGIIERSQVERVGNIEFDKKVQKNLKNLLTGKRNCGIIYKLS